MSVKDTYEQNEQNDDKEDDSLGSDPYVGADPILFDSNSSYKERTMSVTNTELGLDESMTCSKMLGLYSRESLQQSFHKGNDTDHSHRVDASIQAYR